MTRVREVQIKGGVIRLGQLLKVAGIVDSGGEAKALIADGEVTVNGERLGTGDAVRTHGVRDLAVSGTGEVILWDVPPTAVRLEDA